MGKIARFDRPLEGGIRRKVWLPALLFFVFIAVSPGSAETLDQLLAIDRFHFYLTELSHVVRARGKDDIADTLAGTTPEDISRMEFPISQLENPDRFQLLVKKVLARRVPELPYRTEDISWDHAFFRNKLGEAFQVKPIDRKAHLTLGFGLPTTPVPEIAMIPRQKDRLTLNAEAYISDRTTRAVFWDAAINDTPLEFHVGTQSDFLNHMDAWGATVVGEIKPLAHNYNGIFLVRYPGESRNRIAFTGITGKDRLDHLIRQADITSWNGTTARSANRAVSVYGSPEEAMLKEEQRLTQQFERLPKADKVIIGQKRAIETAIRRAAKVEAITRMMAKGPPRLQDRVDPVTLQSATRLGASENFMDAALREGAVVDRVYEALEPLFEEWRIAKAAPFESFTFSNASHEVTDVMVRTSKGKNLRWRLISNMWGDEVVPVAKALRDTGHHDIVYLGTAGALPGTGIRLGEIFVPTKAVDENGTSHRIPPPSIKPAGVVQTGAVTHVGSPFEETGAWVTQERDRASAVELEIAYLQGIFHTKEDRFQPFLIISDIVDSDDETLAEAEAQVRRSAQRRLLKALFAADHVSAPGEVTDETDPLVLRLNDRLGDRDPVSRYQLTQLARSQGIEKGIALTHLVNAEPGFSTKSLRTSLIGAGEILVELLRRAEERGIRPRIGTPSEILDGTYNPRRESPRLALIGSTAAHRDTLAELTEQFFTERPDLKDRLRVEVIRGPPPKDSGFVAEAPPVEPDRHWLWEKYSDSAFRNSGLALQEGYTGTQRFTPLPVRHGEKCSGPGCHLAFFAPDEKTAKLMAPLDRTGDALATLVREAVDRIASDMKNAKPPHRIRLSEVSSLPDGEMARIDPEHDGKSFIVHLKMTKQGMRNRGVVLEEMNHLKQISPAIRSSLDKLPLLHELLNEVETRFADVAHWAETVWNAEAGSQRARRELAIMEVEAIDVFPVRSDEDARYFVARRSHAQELLKTASKAAREETREHQAAWDKTKRIRNRLEANKLKLDDLIAKNDRRGVRKLVESFLPWEMMEPSEAASWRSWLEAIEHPNPELTRVIFRGLKDNVIRFGQDGRAYTFSTVLAKNQGSYTRRLRSLETLRERFGVYEDGMSTVPAITTMMENHAVDPMGSPFLSMANLSEAERWAGTKFGAFRIDARCLIPNIMSYGGEDEHLGILFTFPDELIYFRDYHKEPLTDDELNNLRTVANDEHGSEWKDFRRQVEARLQRKLTKTEETGVDNATFLKNGVKPLLDTFMGNGMTFPRVRGCAEEFRKVVTRARRPFRK